MQKLITVIQEHRDWMFTAFGLFKIWMDRTGRPESIYADCITETWQNQHQRSMLQKTVKML